MAAAVAVATWTSCVTDSAVVVDDEESSDVGEGGLSKGSDDKVGLTISLDNCANLDPLPLPLPLLFGLVAEGV